MSNTDERISPTDITQWTATAFYESTALLVDKYDSKIASLLIKNNIVVNALVESVEVLAAIREGDTEEAKVQTAGAVAGMSSGAMTAIVTGVAVGAVAGNIPGAIVGGIVGAWVGVVVEEKAEANAREYFRTNAEPGVAVNADGSLTLRDEDSLGGHGEQPSWKMPQASISRSSPLLQMVMCIRGIQFRRPMNSVD